MTDHGDTGGTSFLYVAALGLRLKLNNLPQSQTHYDSTPQVSHPRSRTMPPPDPLAPPGRDWHRDGWLHGGIQDVLLASVTQRVPTWKCHEAQSLFMKVWPGAWYRVSAVHMAATLIIRRLLLFLLMIPLTVQLLSHHSRSRATPG